ncbi:hypothetical protein KY284_007708 [Solanum tuberosum]|nr:hypothetical protein KY284_007708 [Solanum tuberosum]
MAVKMLRRNTLSSVLMTRGGGVTMKTPSRRTMNFTKKLYRLRGMSYALQVWIYEYCMQLPPTLVVRHDNLVPRILNWRVVDSQPKFNTIMESIFSNEGNKVSICSW